MAFYIAARCNGHKDRFLTEDEKGWTEHLDEAFKTVSWDDIENKYKALMMEVERHENFNKPVTRRIEEAFPMKSGTLCIVEEVMVALTKRGVQLR